METLAPDLVEAQIRSVLADIPPHAAKTGALGSAAVVIAVARCAESFTFPLVVDPVMISKHGAPLLDDDSVHTLVDHLIPRAFLLTPNLDEASALVGFTVDDGESMLRAAQRLVEMGATNVLIKGGHLSGDALDLLLTSERQIEEFRAPRIDTPHTHGSGCTYSAAITAELAKGLPLLNAVRSAKQFITKAIRTAPGLGQGQGPLNHFA